MLAVLKGTVYLAGTALGSALAGSMADSVITESTPISLGAAIGVGGVVVTVALWISRKMEKQGLMHKENSARFRRLEKLMIFLLKERGIHLPADFFKEKEDDHDDDIKFKFLGLK